MSSDLSGLPPPFVTRASAMAQIQDVAVKLVNLPEGLQNNSAPVKLQGTVAGQAPDGSLRLETERGPLTILLKDRAALPQGATLEIEIPAGRAPQTALIRPALPQATSAPPSLSNQLSAPPESLSPPVRLGRGVPLSAPALEDLLSAKSSLYSKASIAALPSSDAQLAQFLRLLPLPPKTASSSLPPLPVVDVLEALVSFIKDMPPSQAALRATLVTILSRMDLSSLLPSPSSSPNDPISSLIQNIQNLVQPSNVKGLSGTPPTGLILFNPSKPIDAQLLGLSVPPQTGNLLGSPSASASQAPLSIPLPNSAASFFLSPTQPPQNSSISLAQVTGFTPENLPVLTLPAPGSGYLQSYTLQFRAPNLPLNTLALLALPLSGTAAGSELGQTSLSSFSLANWAKPGAWESLDILLQALSQTGGISPQQTTAMIPSPVHPHTTGPLALFFLSVLRSGQMESFFPPDALALLRQKGREDLLKSFAQDLNQTSRLESTPLAQDWKATLIPLLWNNQIQKLPLFYKHMEDDAEADRERRNKALRFLFQLHLSRMGDVQVDGFLKQNNLDLILRTKTPVSSGMQETMKRLYTQTVEKSNLTGELGFQFKPDQWVEFDLPLEGQAITA
ncbi:MAG: hypothetical protein JNN09_03480 [Alphaproteobacteria bacterium]|nr:hypothetical protein [Alphaproteobacteria bacterium]